MGRKKGKERGEGKEGEEIEYRSRQNQIIIRAKNTKAKIETTANKRNRKG